MGTLFTKEKNYQVAIFNNDKSLNNKDFNGTLLKVKERKFTYILLTNYFSMLILFLD